MPIPVTQIKEINNLLLAYSAGKYHAKGKISSTCNELDSIISGINMLGEELLNTTVSRDFFSNIYNASSDMLFVVSKHGLIINVNKPASSVLEYNIEKLHRISIQNLLPPGEINLINTLRNKLRNTKKFNVDTFFISHSGKKIPVEISCSKIINRKNVFHNYLIVARDLTERKMAEQRLLRAVVEAQQEEQKRLSRDIHDNIGPDLSNIQTELSMILIGEKDMNKREIVNSALNKLNNVVRDIRTTCFNIMPSLLERYGLKTALEKMIMNLQSGKTKIQLLCSDEIISMEKPLRMAFYLITREFINNSIKYASAENIYIKISLENNFYVLSISDDGCGFVMEEKMYSGRGLSNIASRIMAFNGNYKFITSPGKGVKLSAEFPEAYFS